VSIDPPEDEGLGAASAVVETPQNHGASQEGATPKPGMVSAEKDLNLTLPTPLRSLHV
jgi:hypothetical protein